ncbi:MAG: EAL domain-containing protein [Lachnospiraceae bacterium]|nr:EAL domain-containing protein [Lachnospiraceae bacterium]
MNIAVQVCGLINTIVLLIFYLSTKRLKLYKRRIFVSILLITIVNILFDIGSIVAIYFKQSLSYGFVQTICRLYLCMLISETWVGLIYTVADIFVKKVHKIITACMLAAAFIECLLIFNYSIHIYTDEISVYTYGPSVTMTYIFTGISICAIWILSFIFESRIKKRRVYSIRLWMVIWMFGMGVQAMDHSLLVVGFATSLGIMVVYFMLENPESFVDKRYNCLNAMALAEYTQEYIFNKEYFALCNFSLENVSVIKADNEESEKRISEFIDYFSQFKKIDVFKNLDKNIILVSENTKDLEDVIDNFKRDICRNDGSASDYVMIFIDNVQNYESIEEVMKIINYMKSRRIESENLVIHVNDKNIEEYKRQDKMKGEIKSALAEDRVEVFLQPIYNTDRERFTSAEALVRIRNKDGSLIPPGLFIPVAEMTGQINELGKRVLEKTCDFMASSDAIKLGIEYVEVNLSVIQAEKITLFEEIMDTVQKYKISPNRINLEITESALIESKDIVIDNMNQLKKEGFTFALDDFGKGESNLMYLVEMPFDILKLDMGMTKAFHVNEKAKSAVKTVRYMADDMKLKIVAEGIENQREMDAFMEYDIDYIQGYHFSKPLPMTEFIDFVREFNEKNKIA